MARKPAATGVGRGDAGQPPPSTLAAQLVQHRKEPGGVATFHQLLDEIIANPATVEANVQENYKLITVVAEAGLKDTFASDPFLASNDAARLLASLDVIEIAFRRNPDVLFYSGVGTEGPGSQICLLLLPKLLSFLTVLQPPELAQRSYDMLSLFFAELAESSQHWLDLPRLADLLQSSAEDIMLVLETSSGANPDQTIDVKLPSAETLVRIGYNGQAPIAVKAGQQIQLRGLLGALYIMSATSSICHCQQANMSHKRPWNVPGSLFRSCKLVARVLRFVHKKQSLAQTGPRAAEELIICIKLVNGLLMSVESDNACVLLRRKVDALAITVTVELLPLLDTSSPPQPVLSELQLLLSYICNRMDSSAGMLLQARTRMLSTLNSLLGRDGGIEARQPQLARTIRQLESVITCCGTEPDRQLEPVEETDEASSHKAYDGDRPLKRRKHNHDNSDNVDHKRVARASALDLASNLQEFCSLLGQWNPNNLASLHRDVAALFSDLATDQQLRVLEILALLPCCGELQVEGQSMDDTESPRRCRFCYSERLRHRALSEKQWNALFHVTASLISCPAIQTSRNLRVALMFAVQRFTWHTPSSKHLSLLERDQSALAQWCLQSLRSSVRELRLVAAHTLPNLMKERQGLDDDFFRKNRVRVLHFLRELSQSQDSRFSEAIISALGQAGDAGGDEEMELVLLQITDFLGSTNPLICSLAQLELRRLAQARKITPDGLFNPFWRTVAITAVKDLPARPQKVQQLSDLLGVSVNQLLLLTQVETLPFLVLWKQQDTIQRLVQARGHDATTWSLCFSPKNLDAILSMILIHHPDNAEIAIAERLKHTCNDFAQEDIPSLLRMQPAPVAFEILRLAGEAEGERRENAKRGFLELAALVERKGQASTRTATTQARMLSTFFDNHALGIMTLISTCIDEVTQPWLDKKRCLRGLEQMITIGHAYLSHALPQIRACLQSALEVPQLRNDAFSAWMCLLTSLENEEDLEGLLDQTFAIITQKWSGLSSLSQQKAYDGVGQVIRDHQSLVQRMLEVLPSFGDIPLMSKYENQLARIRSKMEIPQRFTSFSQRCNEENITMVLQALRELLPYTEDNQQWIHDSVSTEQPDPAIVALIRSLLDLCARFGQQHDEIATLATKCLGIIGCIDPIRFDATRASHDMTVLSNFTQASECLDFVTFMLEQVLVKAFHSAPSTRAQSFLSYVMQELLKFSGFRSEATNIYRPQGSQGDETHQRWLQMSETARNTLTPFLTSHYGLNAGATKRPEIRSYPIFSLNRTHGSWLRDFTHDLLLRGKGDNAQQIFSVLAKVVRVQDLSVANFLLPFAVANVIIGGTQSDATDITTEILAVLDSSSVHDVEPNEREILKSCVESVFQVLDYLSRWLHEKRKRVAAARNIAARSGKPISESEEALDDGQIRSVESVLASIPAEVIAKRSVEVQSLARALLHWEAHIRQQRGKVLPPPGAVSEKDQPLWNRLHKIYANIDEPDGLEGIYTHLDLLGPVEHIQDHQKAGRWAAAESWYEIQLSKFPDHPHFNEDFLKCLSAAGKHHAVLDHAKSLSSVLINTPKILGTAAQAAWNTEHWADLHSLLSNSTLDSLSNFDVALGTALDAWKTEDEAKYRAIMDNLRMTVARSMSRSVTASIQSCHGQLLQLHAMHEVDMLLGETRPASSAQPLLRRRLDVLGTYISDKQYLLSIHRAVLRLSETREGGNDTDIAASWSISARLARKSNAKDVAYNAANNAYMLGDDYACFEQARYLWNSGEHRKAISDLVAAIELNSSKSTKDALHQTTAATSTSLSRGTSVADSKASQQNLLLAKAHLLHAKWLDRGGQTQSSVINVKYQLATRTYTHWEKGLYYLGKFYNKLLESEKSLAASKQSFQYLSGETAKLVIENYLRSLMFGCKYISETMPRLLTLWLEFGTEFERSISKEVPDDTRVRAMDTRPKMMETMNKQVKKYGEKVPTYLFYTALNQMLTRISHKNTKVYEILAGIIIRVIAAHPQQGLWPLLAVVKSSKSDRVNRGGYVLSKLKDRGKPLRHENNNLDIKQLIAQGQKLADTLLHACNVPVDARTAQVSLTRDLGFNAKVAPCALVVPVEKALTATLPVGGEDVSMKNHRAFPMSREAVTISSFSDEVLVLSSLQRPRKIVVRGSDGRKYGLLCKPKDDLRKDQRLMEFNAVINKSLKKDAESSKRRLYIRTYAVTPLNEECGVIEWVDGLKPMRDILINLYRAKGVKVDYNLLRELLTEASAPDNTDGWRVFTETILPMYQPILHEWFRELFPSPDSWFGARLRYTRSCAVASMAGHVLGLGDRHGENVLLEESNGGVFHVDFNCLFDKGLTFEKPELVPFRLTHNMVDAFGAYGVDGPFRRSAECAMAVMRANHDALLTTLETFVYDPTADFVGPRKRPVKGVPETPKEVLESVQGKVRGLMRGDSVPLSVQGHVDALIRQATNPRNLSAMYIGWCAFL